MKRGLALFGSLLVVACTQDGAPAEPATLDWNVTVAVSVPNPCWGLAVSAVYRSPIALLVVSDLVPPAPDVFCAQVVSRAEATIQVAGPVLRVEHLVRGRVWRGRPEGDEPDDVVWVDDENALQSRLVDAKPVRFEATAP